MRSSSGGLLTTVLMLIPLVAVPALAIFGVPGDSLKASLDPEAAPAAARSDSPAPLPPREAESPDSELGEGFLPGGSSSGDPFLDGPVRRPPERTADKDGGSGLEGIDRKRAGERAPRSRPNMPMETPDPYASATAADRAPADRAAADRKPLDEIPFGDPPQESKAKPPVRRDVRPAPRSNGAPSEASAAEAPPAPPRDWQAATARLQQLGIRDFQLLPGEAERQFVFTCRYVLPDNPRVVRRFEAEAGDPLAAVEDVLAQVEEWLSRR